jgi:hypothetical protein
MKEIKRKIHIPIYGGWIVVVITDADDITETAKKHFNCEDDLKNYGAVVLNKDTTTKSRTYPIIFSASENHVPIMSPGIIAHESFHLINHLYKEIGIFHDQSNDEATCYLLSWIVNKITETKMRFDKLK